MQNNRESRNHLFTFVQNVKTKLRFCTGFELICAMACTDRNSKRITACLLNKLCYFFGACVRRIFRRYFHIIFHTCQCAKLSLYYYIVSMCVLNNLLCNFNILLKGILGSINHNRGETTVDTGLTCLKIRTMIQMQCNRQLRITHNSCFHQLHKVVMVCISTGTFGNLQNNRSLFLSTSLCDTLNDFHVVHIESTYGITALIRFLEHFFCCY